MTDTRERWLILSIIAAAAIALLAGLFIGMAIGKADAQNIPECGASGNMTVVPDGGTGRCKGSRILQDGLLWRVIVELRDDGNYGAQFTRPLPAPAGGVPVELEVHLGGSGDGEATPPLTGLLPAGQTQVTLTGSFNPAVLMNFDCVTQTDAKAINGDKDHPVKNRVRIAGGWFKFENCAPPSTTTVATTVGTSPTTGTGPSTSSGTTAGTVPSGDHPSTAGETVPAGQRQIPATGPSVGDILGWGILAVLVGVYVLLIIAGARRRVTDA